MKASKSFTHIITQIAQKHGLDLTQPGTGIKVYNKPYMALSINVINHGIVSVTHYGEQNGDLMADPDVVCLIGSYDGLFYPIEYQNDYIGVKQDSIVEWGSSHTGKPMVQSYRPKLQASIASFASQWAKNIKDQRFLEDGTLTDATDSENAALQTVLDHYNRRYDNRLWLSFMCQARDTIHGSLTADETTQAAQMIAQDTANALGDMALDAAMEMAYRAKGLPRPENYEGAIKRFYRAIEGMENRVKVTADDFLTKFSMAV